MDGLTSFVFKKLIPGVLIFMVVGSIISNFAHNPSILYKDFGGVATLLLAVVVLFVIYRFWNGKRIPTPIWILLTVGIIAFGIYSSFGAWLLPYYTAHPIQSICVTEGVLALASLIQFVSMTKTVERETIGPLPKQTMKNAKEEIDELEEKYKNNKEIGFFKRIKEKTAVYKKAFGKAFRQLLDIPAPKSDDAALKSNILNAYWICHKVFWNIQKKTFSCIFSGMGTSGWVFFLFRLFLRLVVSVYLLNTFVTEATCFVLLSAALVVWFPFIGLPVHLWKTAAKKAKASKICCKYCGKKYSELKEATVPLFWVCIGTTRNGRVITDCPPIPCKGDSCKCDNEASRCVKTISFYICETCAEKVDWKKQGKEQNNRQHQGENKEQHEHEKRHEGKLNQDKEHTHKKERAAEFKTELPRIPIFFDGKEASTYSALASQYVKKTTIGPSLTLLRKEDESGEWLMLEAKRSLFSKQQYRLEKLGNVDSHAVWFFFVLMPNELNRQKVASVLASISDAAIASGILGCTVFLGLDKSVMSAYSSEIERLQLAGFGHGERLRKEICALVLDKERLLDEFHDVFKAVNIRPMSGALKIALEQELQLLQTRFREMEYGQSRN
ncbi:MAG: hypothetical protein IJS08_09920 [Victivallales bacterium]|nr:hypothetical protein [Victivallales bacterium]